MATVTSKGQVTIPKPVRDRLGINPGSKVEFEVAEDGRCRSARLAINGAGPHAFRASRAEQALEGHAPSDAVIAEAAALVAEQAEPRDDALASAWYRRKMAAVVAGRALRGAFQGGPK